MTNKTVFGILVIITFFNSTFAQQKQPKKLMIPTVDFCKLTTSPQKYINKVIRIEASYIVWWESSYLYSESCKNDKHKIQNEFDCNDQDDKCFKRMSMEWGKLNPFLRGKKDSDAQRVKVFLIGRLDGPDSFGHLGSFKYEFRVRKVEKVMAIPKKVSWKGL